MMLIDIMHYGMQVYNCQYAFEEDTVMQWYERTAQSLAGGAYYSHQDLIGRLRQDYPKLSDNSYHWAVSGLLKSGKIIRTGFDTYVIADGRNTAEYLPIYSEHAIKLIQQVESRYPFTGFTVFETVLMNEFLNHLIAQNTVFIQVEKESSIFVFRYLQEIGYHHVLYKPTKTDFRLYWTKDCIVVTDMISEAPVRNAAPHEICLEKLLTDMYCDKLIASTFSSAEYLSVVAQAMSKYKLEKPKMLRYARRRGKEAEIRAILEEAGQNAKP